MGVLAETLGTSPTITHNGKTFTFTLIDQGVKEEYELAFFESAKRRKEALYKRRLSKIDPTDAKAVAALQSEYDASLIDLEDDYECGKFALLSVRGRKAITEPEGIIRLACLLTGANEDDMTALMADPLKTVEVKRVISQIIRIAFPGVTEAADAAAAPNGDGLAPKKSA